MDEAWYDCLQKYPKKFSIKITSETRKMLEFASEVLPIAFSKYKPTYRKKYFYLHSERDWRLWNIVREYYLGHGGNMVVNDCKKCKKSFWGTKKNPQHWRVTV